MSEVLNIQYRLKAKQLLDAFDLNLKRLKEEGVDGDESEAGTIDLLSEWLEEAIENGVELDELHDRARQLAQFAFERGYTQHEVEELLTARSNLNGKRLV